jgi:hypothetical protein
MYANNFSPFCRTTDLCLLQVDYPGGDLRGMHVSLTSDCRTACAGDAACVAFETLPPNGDDNQDNCLLKSSTGFPVKAVGTTSFIKLGHSADCTTDVQGTGYGLFDKRELDEGLDLLDDILAHELKAILPKRDIMDLAIRTSEPPCVVLSVLEKLMLILRRNT